MPVSFEQKKFAVIGDIHGFLFNLKTALEFLDKEDITNIICLGDLVGYGKYPNECVEVIQSNPKIICILGNHDAIVTKDYSVLGCNTMAIYSSLLTRKFVSNASRNYLRQLPSVYDNGDILAVHGSLRYYDEYMHYAESIRTNYSRFHHVIDNREVVFYGHTHHAQVWQISRGKITQLPTNMKTKLSSDKSYFINPGSIGAPRDSSDCFSFVIYDFTNKEVEFIKLKSVDEYLPDLARFTSLYQNPITKILDRYRIAICKRWFNQLGKNKPRIDDHGR
jgi:predicted phosphodiesterase